MTATIAEQRAHFLEHGWVRIPGAIDDMNVERFVGNAWVRLGMDPANKDTWDQEKIHMPRHRQWHPREVSPKAWAVMCDLLGGEDRIDPTISDTWGDGLIINLGTKHWETNDIDPKDLGNWHNDGDWFKHFLDSGEQALIVITLFNDIEPRAGGTYIAEDGLTPVCKWLYDRPEGTDIYLRDTDGTRAIDAIQKCTKFTELTGKKGDVILIHPLMPHSASNNHKRIPRHVTKLDAVMRAYLPFTRACPCSTSKRKLTALRALGVESLLDWKTAVTRERFLPVTRAGKHKLIEAELTHLQVHVQMTGGTIESLHLSTAVV
ncbi:hypothetical protein BDV93DRAFT_458685 [Ceratobasidium sp. AG-I]|nr:hypothetical protein BDV93DRAFT_458685 [Ceratobasidium sp. AG-I]